MKWIKVRSIRIQLLLGFSIIFLCMMGLLLFLNQQFLDDYFLYRNEVNMTRQTEDMSTYIIGENEEGWIELDYDKLISDLSNSTGGEVTIYNSDFSIFDETEVSSQHQTLPEHLLREMVHEADLSDTSSNFTTLGDGDYKDQRIHFVKVLPDNKVLVIDKGLGLVDEAKDVFILFLWIGCIIVYILGLILIYQYANRFTRPIRNLKIHTEKIEKLDFSEKLTSNRDDEIGELINSVDSMASSLEETIGALNITTKDLEIELNKERSLEKMRRHFTANVSHELKNPISMIIGYADGIERGIAKTEKDQKYYASVIKEEGKRMNRLVKDLLDISSYQSGTFTMKRIEFDIAEVFYSTLSKYRKKADEQQVLIKVSGEGSVLYYGDRDRMEQVFTNLLDNAFKHVNVNGKVCGSIDIFDGRLYIILSNTGNIIPEDARDRIFDSFYQVDTDTDGNGLGLTIVKNIVELHDGTIQVKEEDQANVFRIVLPVTTKERN